MFVGKTAGGSIRRSLLAFDLTALPEDAVIDSVSLTLFVSQTNSGLFTHTLHRALADWREGTSDAGGRGGGGASVTAGDATWIHTFYSNSFSSAPGGDFVSTASASLPMGGEDQAYTFASTPQLVDDVQSWLGTPAQNFGWLIRGDESGGGTAKRLDSSENSIPAHRPVLTVAYTVPEPSAALSLLGGAGVLLSRRLRGVRKG